MLAYITKNAIPPEFLKGYPVGKAMRGAGAIWHHKALKTPVVNQRKLQKIDGNTSWYKIDDDLRPEFLLKDPKNSRGSYVQLPDGKNWLIPKIRVLPEMPSDIPLRVGVDDNHIIYTPYPEHQAVHELGPILAAILIDGKTPEQFPAWKWLATILQVNYNITEYDCMAYSLFEQENFFKKIAFHMLDMYSLVEYQEADENLKKN